MDFSAEEAAALISINDADEDDKLSAAEWKQIAEPKIEAFCNEFLENIRIGNTMSVSKKNLFQTIDTSADGFLDSAEMSQF
jgi:hypothetical protein